MTLYLNYPFFSFFTWFSDAQHKEEDVEVEIHDEVMI